MGFLDSFNDEESKINSGTGRYRVMQVVLREKFVGKGSKNFREIEDLCNEQYAEGYRLAYLRSVYRRIIGFWRR